MRDVDKTKEGLREMEERFRSIFEGAPDAIFLADPESGKIIDANPAAWRLLLRSREEIIGLHYSKLHPSELREHEQKAFFEYVQYVKTQQQTHFIESAVIRSDGSTVPVEILAQMIYLRGRPVFRGTFRDITERKQSEKALQESEEKYRSLVESSEDSIYLVDRNCNYVFLNNRHLSRLGVRNGQTIIGKAYGEFHTLEETKKFARKVKRVLKTKKSLSYEYRSQRDNRYFIRTLSPVTSPDSGEINALTVISKDITERKQAEEKLRASEERFRTIFETAQDFIFLKDTDRKFTAVNPAMERHYGLPASKLIGKTGADNVRKEVWARIMDEDLRVLNGEIIIEEHLNPAKESSARHQMIKVPIRNSAGEIIGICGIGRDITERKEAEEKLREREAFNYALFHYNPIETIVVDTEGRVTAFNLAKETSGDRLPTIGDRMYKDYAGKHEIDMHTELMTCIKSGEGKAFPERKYGDKFLNITISPFEQGAIIISEDITKRKRAEEALRESEQFGSSLLKHAPNPIMVINPDTSIRYVNPALEKLTGFPAGELLGRKAPYPWWTEGIVPETSKGLKRTMKQGAQNIQNHFQKKSGEPFWVEITAGPVMHEGKPRYLLTNWIDITERKEVEESLQKERDTFYSILDKSPYGVMMQDTAGNHSFVNTEFTNITGYTLEDIPTTREWLDLAYPDEQYRNMVLDIWESGYTQKKADETFLERFGRVFSRVFSIVCKDGTAKEIEFRKSVIGDAGAVFMLSDITDRRRIQALLETAAAEWRTTFDAISDAVCLLDPHGKIIRCNNAMLRLIEKPFSQITGHHCWEVMHGLSEVPQSCPILRAGKSHHRETEIIPKDSRWFSVSVDPLLDEDGNFIGGVHIMSDITDRKRIDDELKNSREQLRNLALYLETVREQERTNIAREIHDELAQALTALKMDLSWLDHRLPNDAESLIEKTKAMNTLIDSTIGTVKRISAELRPGMLDDLGLVAAIEWQCEEFQKRTDIKCSVSVDPEDIIVDQDCATAIFRIFQETLTNVARHAHATRVAVSLREKSRKLTLRVKDNGVGISDERISDPQSFGLIGMRERIIPWGGTISFKGLPGKGTTVIVSMELNGSKKNIEKIE